MSKQVKQVFEAADGQEFDTKAAAETHNKFLEIGERLREVLDDARRTLGVNTLTADGKPFDPRGWRDFWVVRKSWNGMPRLQEISIWPHDMSFETDRADNALTVRYWSSDHKDMLQFKVSELYADKRAAQKALIAAWEERLAESNEELAKLRSELEGERP